MHLPQVQFVTLIRHWCIYLPPFWQPKDIDISCQSSRVIYADKLLSQYTLNVIIIFTYLIYLTNITTNFAIIEPLEMEWRLEESANCPIQYTYMSSQTSTVGLWPNCHGRDKCHPSHPTTIASYALLDSRSQMALASSTLQYPGDTWWHQPLLCKMYLNPNYAI